MTRHETSEMTVGGWFVEPESGRISRDVITISVRPLVMDLLVYLAKNAGTVVSYEELHRNLWHGKVVSESTVYNCVSELRHILSQGETLPTLIETVPKKGYRLIAEVEHSAPYSADDTSTSSTQTRPGSRHWLTGIVIVAGVSAVYLQWSARTVDETSFESLDQTLVDVGAGVQLPLQLANASGDEITYKGGSVVLSRDGKQIAYIGHIQNTSHLFLKHALDNEPRRIPGSAGASAPVFSPDGRWLAFFANNELKRVPTTGDQPTTIAQVPGVQLGSSWGADNRLVFTTGYRSNLKWVPASGGPLADLTELKEEEITHRFPHALPEGRGMLYQKGSQRSVLQLKPPEIWVLDAESGDHRFLIRGARPKFAADSLLFLRAGTSGKTLWKIPFNINTLKLSGEASPLITDAIDNFDVAGATSLIYVRPKILEGSRLKIVDQHGEQEIFTADSVITHPTFSPDGTKLAASIGIKANSDIWLFDLKGGRAPNQVTSNRGMYPVWKSDSLGLIYSRPTIGIFELSTATLDTPELLFPSVNLAHPMQWLDSGLLFAEINPMTNGDLFFRETGGNLVSIFIDEDVTIAGRISPDLRWIAYSVIKADRPEVFVMSFPKGEPRRVSERGGDQPRWSPDGSRLYFQTDSEIMSVRIYAGESVTFGAAVVEADFSDSGEWDITFAPFDISPDGRQLALVDRLFGRDHSPIFVQNWQQLRN